MNIGDSFKIFTVSNRSSTGAARGALTEHITVGRYDGLPPDSSVCILAVTPKTAAPPKVLQEFVARLGLMFQDMAL